MSVLHKINKNDYLKEFNYPKSYLEQFLNKPTLLVKLLLIPVDTITAQQKLLVLSANRQKVYEQLLILTEYLPENNIPFTLATQNISKNSTPKTQYFLSIPFMTPDQST